MKSITILLALLSFTICAFPSPEGEGGAPVNVPVLVEIDGVKLTLADFGRKHPGGLFQASQSFYQAERKVVEAYVDEYLLEREAQKEHVTVAELLDRHVNIAGAKQPSEDALHVYYEGADVDQPFEVVRQQIIDHIRDSRISKAKVAYVRSLRTQSHVSLLFGAPRAPIDLKDVQLRGPAGAPVVIVEFADYECPYCYQTQAAIEKIEAEYKGKIAFAYKDLPLPNHAHAQKAAEATHCAGAQGKYWEYHDILFKNKALEVPQLKDQARELKLDTNAFDKCLDSGAQAEAVKAQFTEGVSLGLQGTPGFFVNGHVYSGVLTAEQFREIIGQEMAVSGMQPKETAQR